MARRQVSLGVCSGAHFVTTHCCDSSLQDVRVASEKTAPTRTIQVTDLSSGSLECCGALPQGLCFGVSLHFPSQPPENPQGSYPAAPAKSWMVWVENPKHAGNVLFYEPDAHNAAQSVSMRRMLTVRHRSVQGVRPVMSPDGRLLAHVHRCSALLPPL